MRVKVGPVLGALEPEPPAAGSPGGGSGGAPPSPAELAAEEATATYQLRVLLETDRPAWLSALAVDVLQVGRLCTKGAYKEGGGRRTKRGLFRLPALCHCA